MHRRCCATVGAHSWSPSCGKLAKCVAVAIKRWLLALIYFCFFFLLLTFLLARSTELTAGMPPNHKWYQKEMLLSKARSPPCHRRLPGFPAPCHLASSSDLGVQSLITLILRRLPGVWVSTLEKKNRLEEFQKLLYFLKKKKTTNFYNHLRSSSIENIFWKQLPYFFECFGAAVCDHSHASVAFRAGRCSCSCSWSRSTNVNVNLINCASGRTPVPPLPPTPRSSITLAAACHSKQSYLVSTNNSFRQPTSIRFDSESDSNSNSNSDSERLQFLFVRK